MKPKKSYFLLIRILGQKKLRAEASEHNKVSYLKGSYAESV